MASPGKSAFFGDRALFGTVSAAINEALTPAVIKAIAVARPEIEQTAADRAIIAAKAAAAEAAQSAMQAEAPNIVQAARASAAQVAATAAAQAAADATQGVVAAAQSAASASASQAATSAINNASAGITTAARDAAVAAVPGAVTDKINGMFSDVVPLPVSDTASLAGTTKQIPKADHQHDSNVMYAELTLTAPGTITWDFPKPFAAGAVPRVFCQAKMGTSDTNPFIACPVGTPTNTSATFKVYQVVPATLGASLSALIGAVVNVLIPAPVGVKINVWARKP